MRILLVSSGSGSRGGGEIYLLRLARELASREHEVHLLCSDHRRMDELADQFVHPAHVHRLRAVGTYDRPTRMFGAVLDYHLQKKLARSIRKLKPDLIHVNQQVPEDGLDLLLAAKSSGVPYLSTIHITSSARSLNARLGPLRDSVTEFVLRRVPAKHIVVSQHAAEELRGRLGLEVESNRVRVVHNGVCPPSAAAPVNIREQVRRKWGIGPGEIVIGCAARLEAQKNPEFLLQVFARLVEEDLPVRFVWLGEGALLGTMKAKVAALKLEQRVLFDGWRRDAALRMSGFDIFAMASHFEGLPLALLECLCLGLPSCVSNVGGMPEAVTHGVNGYLCELDDLECWSDRLAQLVRDPELRQSMGRSAYALGQAKFSLRRMTDETEAVYAEVMTDARRNSGCSWE